MHAIKATWTNGQILPLEPVDWPEGSELLVEPAASAGKTGMNESDWPDDSESVAAWTAAVAQEWEDDLSDSRQDIYTLADGEPVRET
jgi:hypothetical protein